jgi:hypothetical protein
LEPKKLNAGAFVVIFFLGATPVGSVCAESGEVASGFLLRRCAHLLCGDE